jgi:hypothetical protein
VLCPVAVVAGVGVGLGEKGAVAAVVGRDQMNIGVRFEPAATLFGDTNEGVVQCVEDEGWYRDPVDCASSGGSVVVVFSTGEAGVQGGDAVVQLAQGANAGGQIWIVDMRKQRDLATIADQKSAEELQFIDAILWAMESVGGGAEIERRGYADDRPEFWWRRGAQFAGQFENEIPSHRITDQRHRLQAVLRDEEVHHLEHVI